MTMPLAAQYVSKVGQQTSELGDAELEWAVHLLDEDLPGNVLAYLKGAIPTCVACECKALHIDIGDSQLDDDTRRSLARVFATPFSMIIGEWSKREYGLSGAVKFGWSNLDLVAPKFAEAVPFGSPLQTQYANRLTQAELARIIKMIALDMPRGFGFIQDSAKEHQGGIFAVFTLTPEDAGGRDHWVETIDQLMLIGSTPMRKYVAEWLRREYDIQQFGPGNCCWISFGDGGIDDFNQESMQHQIGQQLTPDC